MNVFLDQFSQLVDPRLAQFLGVAAFVLVFLDILLRIIFFIASRPRKDKSAPNALFKIDDVTHELFKKKGFLTFDLYISNAGSTPIEILQAGFVLADGAEIVIRDEAGNARTPDKVVVEPGQNAFYDNCDFYYTIYKDGILYKKIDRLFVDIRGIGRIYGSAHINPLLNDKQIRGILTDRKGLHGF